MTHDRGTRLGHYELLEPIGAGGMGEVYRARDTKLGRDVAVKVLPEAVAGSPEQLARFEREAQLLASLNHPNIATVHGLEEVDGLAYLVMELVPGETLADMLERGPMPVDESVALIRQIIDGLEAAHENGVVHRDLKPANIIVTPDGVVKILDFGLAKAFEPEGVEVDSSLSPTITRDGTQAGVILGTAAYMSPEQARGKPVDKRTDIFSFGSVVFEMLSGSKAFDGEMVSDILAAVIKLDPDWSKLPGSHLDELVRRCLDKDPRRRLRDIGDARPELEKTPGSVSPSMGGARNLLWLGLGAGLAVGVALALILRESQAPSIPSSTIRFSVPRPSSGLHFAIPMLALSPDGSRLVFQAGGGVFVRHMERDETERIPGTPGRNPFFSPDGQWVGLHDQGQLKKVSLSGGATEIIATVPSVLGADWGDDGTIVFAERYSGIWRVSANGGEPELAVEVEGSAGYPELIGNGRVLFANLGDETSTASSQIMAASLDTGETTALNLRGTQPRYLPSGHLVFVEGGALQAVAFDRESLRVRGEPVTFVEDLTDAGGILVAHYAISDSGTLAYWVFAPTRELAWVDRRGNTVSRVLEPRGYADLRLSPDGESVALFDLSAALDIWNYNMSRQTFTRISLSSLTDEVPVWSPDGRVLAYTTAVPGGGRILHRRASDGSGSEVALWQSPYHTHVADWTQDGKTLVLNESRDREGTGWDVLVLDADGEPSPTYLLESRFDEVNPRLHPGGRWLAYMSDETGQREIYVTSFPEPGEKHAISSGGGLEPVWSPDGTELFYRNETDIVAVDVSAGVGFSYGRPVALFRDSFEDAAGLSHTAYDVHPDGRFLFVVRPEAAQDDAYRGLSRYQIVVNWMREVEQRIPRD